MYVSALFCEVMLPNEAIDISGVIRFSDYQGYGYSLDFKQMHKGEQHPGHFLAIDAMHWNYN